MHLIELYILRRVSTVLFLMFVVAIGVTWTAQVLSRINFLTTTGQTCLAIFKISILLIPTLIPLVMPFSLVIAITQTLAVMQQDSELVIINTTSHPYFTIWRPILILGISISICSFIIANFITPYARLRMRKIIQNSHVNLISLSLEEKKFHKLENNLYLRIGKKNADGSISQLFIVDQRNPSLDFLYYSIKGNIIKRKNQNFLILEDGEIQRRDIKKEHVSIIAFDKYAFRLNNFILQKNKSRIFAKDHFLTYLLNPDPNDIFYKKYPKQYISEFHKRCTEWLYAFIFSLVSLVISKNVRKKRIFHVPDTVFSVVISILIYWTQYFFSERSENNLFYIPFLYIIPISLIIFLSILLISDIHYEHYFLWKKFVSYNFFKKNKMNFFQKNK